MGGRGASATGFSPSFGKNYAPAQTEPPVDDAGQAISAAAAASNTDGVESPGDDDPTATPKKRSRWLPGSDNEPQRKALPVSSRTAAVADDDGQEL